MKIPIYAAPAVKGINKDNSIASRLSRTLRVIFVLFYNTMASLFKLLTANHLEIQLETIPRTENVI